MKTIVNYAELIKEKHALNETIAPVETDLTDASQEYAIGQKFINDGILYRAKTPIAQHDALVLNTNYEAADDLETQLANEAAVRAENGAHNRLPFDLDVMKALNTSGTWAGNVYSYRNVTFTVNADGTVTADGQATGGNASMKIYAGTADYPLIGKQVIMSGCPSGGSASSYAIQGYRLGSADGSGYTYFDYGNGSKFQWKNNASGTIGSVSPVIYEDYDADNLVFKPMVRLATDDDGSFQPYAKTNKELTDDVTSLNSALSNKADSTDVATADNATRTMIAPIETSPSANAYSVGDFLIYNNVLYKVKAAITATDALVVDTNIEVASDLETQIKAKQDALTIDATPTSASTNPVQSGGTYDFVSNKHKITRKTVNTSNWTTDTTSQSGTTLYKKSISLSHVYVDSPTVDIATSSGTGLPTTAQQTAYDLLQYVTVDGTTMYLYASAVPSTTFYVQIEGVD